MEDNRNLTEEEQKLRERCFNGIEKIMNVPYSKYARKRIDSLSTYYTYDKIISVMLSKYDYLVTMFNKKTFDSEDHAVNYLIKIIQSELRNEFISNQERDTLLRRYIKDIENALEEIKKIL